MRPMTPLCALARKHQTDKGGRHYFAGDTCHEYTPVYYDLLQSRQHDVHNVLEIGVNYGCSLRMWRDFFPLAQIIGFDSNAEALYQEERIRCYAADQNNGASLDAALREASCFEFGLIVDDGSHETDHQIFSMRHLLPFLTHHGIYVIEDLQIDCKPEIVSQHVPPGFIAEAIRCEPGLGKAICGCGCGTSERLLVIRRG